MADLRPPSPSALPPPAGTGSDARRDLLANVVAVVPAARGADCVRVGVDGVDGSGKTTFADELAAALRSAGRPVVRICADDFHHPRVIRYRRGRHSPQGFWLDSYDVGALVDRVLRPCGPDGSRRYRPAVHDLASDSALDPPVRTAPRAAVVIVDGLFLHRDELAGQFELTIWLDVPFEVTAARMAVRDGSSADAGSPGSRRYVEGQRLYFAACRPWERADIVIDNTELSAPVLRSP